VAIIQNLIDSLPASVALLDQQGRILRTNAAWRSFIEDAGLL